VLRESLLADFDHELTATRHVLTRTPDTDFSWRPHARSFTLGGLATHLANLPHWGHQILERDKYDLALAGPRAPELPTRTEVLTLFDRHVAEARRALVGMSDAELQAPWQLTRGEQVLLSVPKMSALRTYLLHHLIHHRGQLTVYLRLQGVPVPPLYGPTADES
jgi:uncharacterized damage-inducible protein DinB